MPTETRIMPGSSRPTKMLELETNRDGDHVLFELEFFCGGWGGDYRFYPSDGSCFHLHEDAQGKRDSIVMQKTHIHVHKIAFHCFCGLRFVLPGFDLDFGHPVLYTEKNLQHHFSEIIKSV